MVQSLSRVRLFVTPWTAAHQASLCFTVSWTLLKLKSIESVMPSSHLIVCRPLLLLPSILPSIRVFSSESILHIRWPKYWSFSFSISLSSEYSGWFPIGLTGLSSLLSKRLSTVFSSTTIRKHWFFGAQPYLRSNSHISQLTHHMNTSTLSKRSWKYCHKSVSFKHLMSIYWLSAMQ